MPAQFSTPKGDALRTAKTQAGTNPLDGLTVTQALTWIDSNVTDLPSARTALKQMVKTLFILDRRVDRLEAALQQYRQSHE